MFCSLVVEAAGHYKEHSMSWWSFRALTGPRLSLRPLLQFTDEGASIFWKVWRNWFGITLCRRCTSELSMNEMKPLEFWLATMEQPPRVMSAVKPSP